MTIKILHVAQPIDAGVPGVVSALVADQVARGWDVSVASPPAGDLERTTAGTGARWRSWPAGRNPGPASIAESRRLAAIVREVGPDLVHLHSAKAGLAGRLVLRGRLPTVFQPHAWSFEAASGPVRAGAVAWERIAARWTDVVVCVSGDERATGERAGVAARYAEVPNGVDLTRYTLAGQDDRAAARRALGIDPGAPLAVVVGRLARQKGQDVLLAAWPRVRAQVPDAQLALVGDGPDRPSLEATAPPEVRFAGQSDDVAKWYAAATVAVIPSRWEGLSLVVIEAMARGRSVVASDVAGMSQALDGGAGALVAPEAPEPLADALAERLADPALADGEGAAGRARVEQRFDVRVAAERIAELYGDTLARRSS